MKKSMTRSKKLVTLALAVLMVSLMLSSVLAAYIYESRYGHNTLKVGHTGTYVANLQSDINSSGDGYCGTVDGIFGNGTKGGVEQYQAKHSLSVDGQAGYNTKTALWYQVGRFK